jgi:hypothetical protein
MPKIFYYMVVILLFGHQCAFGEEYSRPATSGDFVGIFKLLDFPIENQPKILKENPWPAPCQFFGHYPSGYWLHQQVTFFGRTGSCNSAIPKSQPTLPQVVEWKMIKDGLVTINRKDQKFLEIWKIDRVIKDSHLATTDLSDGDLIMQLIIKNREVGWFRLLHRLSDVDNAK